MKNKLLFLAIILLFTLNGFSQAIANEAPDIQQCGNEVFNLTVQTPIILGDQDPENFTVTYYLTEADAQAGTNPIVNISAFVPFQTQSMVIYAAVNSSLDDSFATTSFNISWGSVWVPEMPDVNVCYDYSLPVLQTGNYFTGPGGTGTMIAQGFVITTTQTIYIFREQNGCIAETSFTVTVLGPVTTQPSPLYACDENGDAIATFDLNEILPQIMGDASEYEAHFFETMADADSNMNVIANPSAYTNITPGSQMLYARILSNDCVFLVGFTIMAGPCTGNTIEGFASLDLDGNGCDVFEAAASGLPVSYTNNDIIYTTYTNADGYYSFENVPDGVNVVTAVTTGFYTATPGSYTFTMPAQEEDVNFCITPTEIINDVSVVIVPTSQARPGFAATYSVIYQNLGSVAANGTISLQFDASKMTFVSASPAMVQAGNTITFSYTNLLPFDIKFITLHFTVMTPPTVNSQDVLVFTATIDPVTGDANPVNNTSVFNQIVVNSYDPNDIAVREGEFITEEQADDYLNYTIRFQNTGDAEAINIKIKNTLDDNLDWSTFHPVAASHTYKTYRVGNEVEFLFDNIHLADSISNEPASHGHVIYRIKPKASVTIGDSMSATASIYFDFNLPIVTNTVMTTVQNVAGVKENAIDEFVVYPNPASGKVTLQMLNTSVNTFDIIIFDVVGKKVLEDSFLDNQAEVNISTLKAGVYFISINNDGKQLTKKLVVK